MKSRIATLVGGGLALTVGMMTAPSAAEQAVPPTSNRVALVIGEGAYGSGALPAAPNDAGLVAETLAGAGFDVTGARDLDGDGLRGAVRDFLDKAGAAGPDGIAIVYFAGRALQFDGDNYFAPVDARLTRPSDVPIETLRLGDLDRALAALPIQAKVVVVDGAYAGQPTVAGLPPGLALVEAEQGELLAFNTAPGTEAPRTANAYGIYAQSFVEAMKQGGAPVEDVFDRLRLSVETATGGVVVPFDSDKLTRSFKFFERAADAPLVESAQIPFAALQKRPLRDFPPDQAYDVVIARDTLPAYAEFLTTFPGSPLARRIRLLQAVRREALFWNAAVRGGTPPAFWTYLARYPKGPHVMEAHRRLSRLAVASLPPASFAPLLFDVPPPPEAEIVLFEQPLVFDGPDFPPPARPPVFLLPPPVATPLPPPPRPPGPGFLPIPIPVAIPSVRAFGDAGSINPPRAVKGAYPRPRPFVRGPNGDGLMVGETIPPNDALPGRAPDKAPAGSIPRQPPAADQRPLAGQLPLGGQLPPTGQRRLPAAQPSTVGRPVPHQATPPLTTSPVANPLPTMPDGAGQSDNPALRTGKPPGAGDARVDPHATAKPAAPDPLSAPTRPAARPSAAQPAASGHPAELSPMRGDAGSFGSPRPPAGVASQPPAKPVGLPKPSAPPPTPPLPRAVPVSPPAVQQRLPPEPRPLPESRPAALPRTLPQPEAPRPAEGPRSEAGPAKRRLACGHPGEPPCHP